MSKNDTAVCVIACLFLIGGGCRAQLATSPSPVRVLSSHWVALRFAPEYPHGRHTQNPVSGDGLTLPASDSTFILGQAGDKDQKTPSGQRIVAPLGRAHRGAIAKGCRVAYSSF